MTKTSNWLSDDELIAALDSDTPFNEARKKLRFFCAAMESARISPIEQRKREFEMVLEIIDTFYDRKSGGLSAMGAAAILAGNVPLEDITEFVLSVQQPVAVPEAKELVPIVPKNLPVIRRRTESSG